jgi:hypothetical protein
LIVVDRKEPRRAYSVPCSRSSRDRRRRQVIETGAENSTNLSTTPFLAQRFDDAQRRSVAVMPSFSAGEPKP